MRDISSSSLPEPEPFILTADYAFGHKMAADLSRVVKENGGTVLGEVRAPLNTQDFSSFLVHDMLLVEVKKPNESKAAWDYYKVLRTIAANDAAQPLDQSKCALVKK